MGAEKSDSPGVALLRIKEEPQCLVAVSDALKKTPGIPFHEIGTIEDLIKLVHSGWSGMAYLILNDQAHLLEILKITKTLQREIKVEKSLRIGVFTRIDNSKLHKTLQTSGVAEVIGFELTAKALLHKFKYHLKLVKKKLPQDDASFSIEIPKSEVIAEEAPLPDPLKTEIVSVNPLTIAEDFWLLQKESHIRYVNSSWLIEILGPGPVIGSWEADESLGVTKKKEKTWRWTARKSGTVFTTSRGSWYFTGRRPEFYWRSDRWRFVGASAALFFLPTGASEAERVYRFSPTSPSTLKIPKNSPQAENVLPQIMATIRKSVQFKTEEAEGTDLEMENEEEVAKALWNEAINGMKPEGMSSMCDGAEAPIVAQSDFSITLDLPSKNRKQGDRLSFELEYSKDGIKTSKEVAGSISDVKNDPTRNRERVEVKFDAPSLSAFQALQDAMSKRQIEILNFLLVAKGSSPITITDITEVPAWVSQYITQNLILIVDTEPAARQTLASELTQLGANPQNLILVSSHKEAETIIQQKKPKMIFSEYTLDQGASGLELLSLQRKAYSTQEMADSFFAVVTANSFQSAVARAAEEDVDTFIIKPFSLKILRTILIPAIDRKLRPDAYSLSIGQGIEFLALENYDQASLAFEKALPLSSTPSLAHSYLGETYGKKKSFEPSLDHYKLGLAINPLHYRCLNGLYELLLAQKSMDDAYDVAKKLAQNFPGNPKRLTTILRLVIVTENYSDMDHYYQIFTALQSRPEELIRFMSSALSITGKYYLTKKNKVKALEYFDKAVGACGARTTFLRFIVETLVDYNMKDEASKYLKKFPPETHTEENYQVAKSLLTAVSQTG